MDIFEVEKHINPDGDIKIEAREAFSYPLHTHTYCEMTLYEGFEGCISINGTDVNFCGTAAVLVTPLDLHAIGFSGNAGAKYIKIGFNADTVRELSPDAPIVYRGAQDDGFFRSLFYEMLKNKKDSLSLRLLIGCAVNIMKKRGESVGQGHSRSSAYAALKLINDGFRDDITLVSVAERLSVSPQHLSALFKESFGVNFSKYLSDLRLRYAKGLIESTDESVTDICFESGYSNFSHFSRSFKRAFGASPREYRAKSHAKA